MATEAPPPTPPEYTTAGGLLYTRIRLATVDDIPHMHKLIHQLAVFEHLTHQFEATAAALSATIFPPNPPPPFTSITTFLLEVSTSPFSPSHNPHFAPLLHPLRLDSTIEDHDKEAFRSRSATVAGFVLFFPKYATLQAKPGFYVQNIHVRECYRGKGMGKLLLSAVAAQAAAMGYASMEWIVADWNVAAVKFYERMGAETKTSPERILCRLTGEALRAYDRL